MSQNLQGTEQEEIALRSIRERQADIKAMGTAELRRKLTEGRFGVLRPFAKAELEVREVESEEDRLARIEARDESTRRIAICANVIAAVALIAAIATAIIAFLTYSAGLD